MLCGRMTNPQVAIEPLSVLLHVCKAQIMMAPHLEQGLKIASETLEMLF